MMTGDSERKLIGRGHNKTGSMVTVPERRVNSVTASGHGSRTLIINQVLRGMDGLKLKWTIHL